MQQLVKVYDREIYSFSQIPQVPPAEETPSQIQMEQKVKKRTNTKSPGQGLTSTGPTGTNFLTIYIEINFLVVSLVFNPPFYFLEMQNILL